MVPYHTPLLRQVSEVRKRGRGTVPHPSSAYRRRVVDRRVAGSAIPPSAPARCIDLMPPTMSVASDR